MIGQCQKGTVPFSLRRRTGTIRESALTPGPLSRYGRGEKASVPVMPLRLFVGHGAVENVAVVADVAKRTETCLVTPDSCIVTP